MTTEEVEARLEAFVRTAFAVQPDDPRFDRAGDLFEGGYVDSVGLAELLEFIRVEFGVDVPEEDLLADEFAAINGIAKVVVRLAQP